MLHPASLGNFWIGSTKVEGDPVQLQQVLLNLIINAFDAMRDTPLSRHQVVIATGGTRMFFTRVSVRDYGVGIWRSASDAEQFSPRGSRVGDGSDRAFNVESHGGTIAAENADGDGARFQFTIPADSRKVSE
jgi:signal transduction histidine kinase